VSPSEVRGGPGWGGCLAAPRPSSRGVGLGFRARRGFGSAVLVSRSLSGLGVGYPASEVFPKTPRCRSDRICGLRSRTVTVSFRVSGLTSGLGGLGLAEAVLATQGASPGVSFPFSVSQAREPALPGFASPGTFRSRGFAPPQRLTSPSPSWVCFTPVPLLGFPLQGLPFRESRNASRRPLPSCRFTAHPLQKAPPPPCPGREVTSGSASGVCSLPESVRIGSGVSRPERRCPPGFRLSRGFTPSAVHPPFGGVPLMGFAVRSTPYRPRG